MKRIISFLVAVSCLFGLLFGMAGCVKKTQETPNKLTSPYQTPIKTNPPPPDDPYRNVPGPH